LFVHSDKRGKGVGKNLLEYLLAKVTGSTCLYVAKTISSAKKFYSQYSFKVVNEFQIIYNGKTVYTYKMIRDAKHLTPSN